MGQRRVDHFLAVTHVFIGQIGFTPADFPANHFDGQAGTEAHTGGFRIAPDVIFGGGGDVADDIGRATHHDAAADIRDDFGRFGDGGGHVGHGAKRHKDDAGIRFDGIDQDIDGMAFGGRRLGLVVVVAHAIGAVKEIGAVDVAGQGGVDAVINRDVFAADFNSIARVDAALGNGHIACYNGNRLDLNIRGLQRHQDGNGIIGGGIGVNNHFTGHTTILLSDDQFLTPLNERNQPPHRY